MHAQAMTEWQEHVTACLDVVGQVAELFPGEVLGLAFPLLQQHADTFGGIHACLVRGGPGQVCSSGGTARMPQTIAVVASPGLSVSVFARG